MSNRSGGEVELVALALVLALLAAGVARLLDRSEVLAGDVSGDVDAVEARSLELGELRVDRAHRGLERVEVLVDDRVGSDLARPAARRARWRSARPGSACRCRRHWGSAPAGQLRRRTPCWRRPRAPSARSRGWSFPGRSSRRR